MLSFPLLNGDEYLTLTNSRPKQGFLFWIPSLCENLHSFWCLKRIVYKLAGYPPRGQLLFTFFQVPYEARDITFACHTFEFQAKNSDLWPAASHSGVLIFMKCRLHIPEVSEGPGPSQPKVLVMGLPWHFMACWGLGSVGQWLQHQNHPCPFSQEGQREPEKRQRAGRQGPRHQGLGTEALLPEPLKSLERLAGWGLS